MSDLDSSGSGSSKRNHSKGINGIDFVTPTLGYEEKKPNNEEKRLRILHECNILGTDCYEPDFDRYTALARRIFGTPASLINFIDKDTIFIKSNLGLGYYNTEAPRDHSFTSMAICEKSDNICVITDASTDPRVSDNYYVKEAHLRFYAAGMIIIEGCKIGTVEVFDYEPRDEFSLDDQMTLLDITAAVTNILVHRRLFHLLRLKEQMNYNRSMNQIDEHGTTDSSNGAGETASISSNNTPLEDERPASIVGDFSPRGAAQQQQQHSHPPQDIKLEPLKHPNEIAKEVDHQHNTSLGTDMSSTSPRHLQNNTKPVLKPLVMSYQGSSRHNMVAASPMSVATNSTTNSNGNLKPMFSPSGRMSQSSTTSSGNYTRILGAIKSELDNDGVMILSGSNSRPSSAYVQDDLHTDSSKELQILMVEDNTLDSKQLIQLFGSLCTVRLAVNGLQGLIMLKENTFDIVIVSFLMPVMNGVEMLQNYAAWCDEHPSDSIVRSNKDCLFIGTSLTANKRNVQSAFEYGMHCFTKKPIHKSVIKLAVNLKRSGADHFTCTNALAGHFACITSVIDDKGSCDSTFLKEPDNESDKSQSSFLNRWKFMFLPKAN